MSFKFSSLFLPIKDFAIKLKKKDIKDVVTNGTTEAYSLKYIEKTQGINNMMPKYFSIVSNAYAR